jgi:hypothetical protein
VPTVWITNLPVTQGDSSLRLAAGTGKVIDMTDGTSTISTGGIETPALIQVKYTAPSTPRRCRAR